MLMRKGTGESRSSGVSLGDTEAGSIPVASLHGMLRRRGVGDAPTVRDTRGYGSRRAGEKSLARWVPRQHLPLNGQRLAGSTGPQHRRL